MTARRLHMRDVKHIDADWFAHYLSEFIALAVVTGVLIVGLLAFR